jgi:RimJ/RimL family protein N-acetyltransferase
MFGPKIAVEFHREEKKDGPIKLEFGLPQNEEEYAKLATGWLNDSRIRVYMSMLYPLSLSGEIDWVRKQNTPEKENSVIWCIHKDGKPIGSVGLNNIDKVHRKAELGILIGEREEWGKGIAQAAEAVAVEFGFSNIVAGGLNKIWASVLDGNNASREALRKVGFSDIGVLKQDLWHQGKWYDTWQGEILNKEWREIRLAKFKQVGIKKLTLYPGCEDIGFPSIVVK